MHQPHRAVKEVHEQAVLKDPMRHVSRTPTGHKKARAADQLAALLVLGANCNVGICCS
jgi:hypothetical protein